MKRIIPFFIIMIFAVAMMAQTSSREQIINSYNEYNKTLPLEKIYIQTDLPLYKPGDVIWFKPYLVNAKNMSSQQSDVLYAELINPRGNVERKLTISKKQGTFQGEFQTQTNASGGIYKIRCYTNWMKNFGEENYFEREITIQGVVTPRILMKLDFENDGYGAGDEVTAKFKARSLDDVPLSFKEIQGKISLDGKEIDDLEITTDNKGEAKITFTLPKKLDTNDGLLNLILSHNGNTEAISRSIPIVLNNIDLYFFPEGGDMIVDAENRIAFKAMDEFGKGADIKGAVLDSRGKVVTTFDSFHKGMGAFSLDVKNGEKYKLQITQPKGIDKMYELPSAINGYGLNVLKQDKNGLTINVQSPRKNQVQLVSLINGKIKKTIELNLEEGRNKINLSTSDLPVGILQLTLIDNDLKPHAERLVFVNKHRKLDISISTDKEKYSPMEDVNLSLKIKDENGNPLQGDFSVAVVDDQVHTFADDKQDNILSRLLVTAELKGEIEEPNFYFDPEEEKADEAIDYVMMTHGWRRFQWRDILKKSETDFAKQVKNEADELVVMGRATIDGKPLANIRVWTDGHKQFAKTDKNGVFVFEDVEVPVNIHFKHRGLRAKGYFYYKIPKSFQFNNYPLPPSSIPLPTEPTSFAASESIDKLLDDVADVEVEEKGVEDLLQGKVAGIQVTASRSQNKDFSGASIVVSGDEIFMETLEEEPMMLDEVVVSGYTMSQKEMAVSSVQAIVREEALPTPGDAGYFFDTGVGFDVPNVRISTVSGNQLLYNAKQFYAPRYNNYHRQNPERYTDERKTIYWNPAVKMDKNGEAKFTFSQGTLTSTYRIILEGITKDGTVIRAEDTYISQEPFNMDCKTPVEVTHGDELVLPIVFQNNTDKSISGDVQAVSTPGMTLAEARTAQISIPANGNMTHYFKMKVSDTNLKGMRQYTFSFTNNETKKQSIIRKNIKINNKGFPRNVSLSSKEMQRTFNFNIDEYLDNSLTGELNIYPNIMDELMSGTESIFREPYGCFEQTSSSNYPNIMALQYMQEQGGMNPVLQKKALGYLHKGYNRLAGFECSNGGFSLYGNDPAVLRLTAYGLHQFHDLSKVYNGVDKGMVERTKQWLMDKRNGNGGFKGANAAGNAYIACALTETGETSIRQEVSHITEDALSSNEAYKLALAAISNYNLGNSTEAEKCISAIEKQAKNGFDKLQVKETFMYSYGKNRLIEATALYVTAKLRGRKADIDADLDIIEQAVLYMSQGRSGYGGFGSTQTTILSLKAFTAYAKYRGKMKENGRVRIYANDQEVKEINYKAGQKGRITVDLKPFLKKGQNSITVSFDQTKEALPYAANINWTSLTPNSSKDCRVDLETKIATNSAKIGETVRLSANIRNVSSESVPTPIALIGIPAGLSLQPWQLKEMVEKQIMDYYEISGNYLVCYFTELDMAKSKTINLDLKADIPGTYKAPASTAYLYYDKQDKDWDAGKEITIQE